MKRIAIAMQKGGTGKTTTTINLAGALAQMGQKVLVIDLDPQANLTRSFGVMPETHPDILTTYDILIGNDQQVADAIIDTGYGIDLIPSDGRLSDAEQRLPQAINYYFKLDRKLKEITDYDFILLDCRPTLGPITLNAFAAADEVLAVLNCEDFAVQGLGDFLTLFDNVKRELNPRVKLVGVLLTQYSNQSEHKRVVSEVQSVLGNTVLKTIIGRRAVLTSNSRMGPVQFYSPSSASAIEYRELASELIERIGNYAT